MKIKSVLKVAGLVGLGYGVAKAVQVCKAGREIYKEVRNPLYVANPVVRNAGVHVSTENAKRINEEFKLARCCQLCSAGTSDGCSADKMDICSERLNCCRGKSCSSCPYYVCSIGWPVLVENGDKLASDLEYKMYNLITAMSQDIWDAQHEDNECSCDDACSGDCDCDHICDSDHTCDWDDEYLDFEAKMHSVFSKIARLAVDCADVDDDTLYSAIRSTVFVLGGTEPYADKFFGCVKRVRNLKKSSGVTSSKSADHRDLEWLFDLLYGDSCETAVYDKDMSPECKEFLKTVRDITLKNLFVTGAEKNAHHVVADKYDFTESEDVHKGSDSTEDLSDTEDLAGTADDEIVVGFGASDVEDEYTDDEDSSSDWDDNSEGEDDTEDVYTGEDDTDDGHIDTDNEDFYSDWDDTDNEDDAEDTDIEEKALRDIALDSPAVTATGDMPEEIVF